MVVEKPNPTFLLTGRLLDGGWMVTEPLPQYQGQTGGHFSIGYQVQNANGRRAYLKVLNWIDALDADDFAREIQRRTEAFNFERDLLDQCRRLSRVVTALADGTIRIDNMPIQYLIFELADSDARRQIQRNAHSSEAWVLRTLHEIAVGLRQLHGQKIAHQDIKPSNILLFDDSGAKLGDLGRAVKQDVTAPHEAIPFPGAMTYCPLECLYGYLSPDWYTRRIGGDLYLLGSIIHYFFVGTPVTVAIASRLQPAHHWSQWSDTYESVMPFLVTALDDVLSDFMEQADISGAADQEEICSLVRCLCNPDPAKRGHPRSIAVGQKYSLERVVSRFDFLARRAELRASIRTRE